MTIDLDHAVRSAVRDIVAAAPPIDGSSVTVRTNGPVRPRRRYVAVAAGIVAVCATGALVLGRQGYTRPYSGRTDQPPASEPVPTESSVQDPSSLPASTSNQVSHTTITTTAAEQKLLMPADLPTGWKIWTVSRTSSVRDSTEQLFGRYDAAGFTGMLVAVTSQEFLGVGAGAETITVRGQTAGIFADADGLHVEWSEDGVLIDVTARGLDRERVLGVVESLILRNDPLQGFEPSSAVSDLPLVIEAVAEPDLGQTMTGFRVSPDDGPTFEPDDPNGGSTSAMIRVSTSSNRFGSAPEIMFRGVRDGDRVVADDGASAVFADGTIVVTDVGEQTPPGFARQLLDSMAPLPFASFMDILSATSDWFARLPEAASSTVTAEATVRLRGGTTDAPDALCLQIGSIEQCRWALTASPFTPPSWVTTALIDGRWFAFGAEAADQPDLVVSPWSPTGPPLGPIASTDHVADGVRYWVAEIPDDISDVVFRIDGRTDSALWTSMRRQDR